jgi:streptomycin 6-kinase
MEKQELQPLHERAEAWARAWNVTIERTRETPTSFLGFGMQNKRPVVLKVIRQPGDVWRCGAVLDAFDGVGVVRVYASGAGAALLERLAPGTPLAALSKQDDEATEILAGVIWGMDPQDRPPAGTPTVAEWGRAFTNYLASGDGQLPLDLVEPARRMYDELCATQRSPRLLHGDLQHYNVLYDMKRGWVVIDPKGVVGEAAYEVGAWLRNPWEKPSLFTDPGVIERRVRCFEAALDLDGERVLGCGFAQAVLSAIWTVEDGLPPEAATPALRLARAIQQLLGGR